MVKKKGTSNFNQVSILSFSDTILLRYVRTRCLTEDILRTKKRLKLGRHIFTNIVSA